MANILLYLYCFSLPYQAITIGGIAIVKITGLLLSGWLALELGFRRFHKSDLFVVLLVSMAPLYLLVMEAIRTSAGYAINFYTPFISNAETPFGGIKQSGYGREGGSMGIKDYLNIKYTHLGITG